MSLSELLREIEGSPGATTVDELASRLRTTPARVNAMLAALRASGRLLIPGAEPGTHECASGGGCMVACPGPESCPFVIDLSPGLGIRRR